MIDVEVYDGDELVPSQNLESWSIVTVEKRFIEIDLVFKKPLHVSQGYNHDVLLLQIALSNYPDQNSNSLPISVNRIKSIPR